MTIILGNFIKTFSQKIKVKYQIQIQDNCLSTKKNGHKMIKGCSPSSFLVIAVHLAVACDVYDGVFLCCPVSHEMSWIRS